MDSTNVSSRIREIVRKEQEAEEERRLKREYDDKLNYLKNEINELEKRCESIEKELSENEKYIDQLRCDLCQLKIKYENTKKVSLDVKNLYEMELKKMDETCELIWSRREEFCDKVNDFIDNFGIVAKKNKLQVMNCQNQLNAAIPKNQISAIQIDDELNMKKREEIKLMENEFSAIKESLNEETLKLENKLKVIHDLEKDFINSFEYVSLLNTIKIRKIEIEQLRKKFEFYQNSYKNNIIDKEDKSENKMVTKKSIQLPITNFVKTIPKMDCDNLKDEQDVDTSKTRTPYVVIEILSPIAQKNESGINHFWAQRENYKIQDDKTKPIDVYKEIMLDKEKVKLMKKGMKVQKSSKRKSKNNLLYLKRFL